MVDGDLTLVPLVTALDDVGLGTVLAAPVGSDGPEGRSGSLRGSDVDGVVSSVDRLETVTGVTVTVRALAEQLAGGVGHYGTGEGVDGPPPTPGREAEVGRRCLRPAVGRRRSGDCGAPVSRALRSRPTAQARRSWAAHQPPG